jgi:hypothetical protein
MMFFMTAIAIAVALAIAALIKIREAQGRAELERHNDRLSGFGASLDADHRTHVSLVE